MICLALGNDMWQRLHGHLSQKLSGAFFHLVGVGTVVICWAISILKFNAFWTYINIFWGKSSQIMVLALQLFLSCSVTCEQLTPVSIYPTDNDNFSFYLVSLKFYISVLFFFVFPSSCLCPLDVRNGVKVMFVEKVKWGRKTFNSIIFSLQILAVYEYVNMHMCMYMCVNPQWADAIAGEIRLIVFLT